MTFILSCATENAVYQVSDRRLTWLGGPSPGSVKDDESNKAVLIDGRMAYGYTGIAEVGGIRTDDWLAGLFGNQSTSDLAAVAERIRSEATTAFARMTVADIRWTRHAFVGIGWGTYRGETQLEPILVTISNALSAEGEWEIIPSDQFRTSLNQWGATLASFSIAAAGQSITNSEKKAIWRYIRRVVRKGAPPTAMIRALSDCRLWIAKRYSSVGAGLLAMCIPKAAVERQRATGQILALTGPPGDDYASFVYRPSDGANLVIYGPHFAAGGGVMTNFTLTPLPPAV